MKIVQTLKMFRFKKCSNSKNVQIRKLFEHKRVNILKLFKFEKY
jgi:hypothetical protein